MTTDIQRARDVLAKWRDGTTPAPWEVRPWVAGFDFVASDAPAGDLGGTRQENTARLIVGTAGNPALLDAIDEMLAMWADWSRLAYLYVPDYIESIAAAIIKADERMSA